MAVWVAPAGPDLLLTLICQFRPNSLIEIIMKLNYI